MMVLPQWVVVKEYLQSIQNKGSNISSIQTMLPAKSFTAILKVIQCFRVHEGFLTPYVIHKKIILKEFTKQFIQTNTMQNYEINKLTTKDNEHQYFQSNKGNYSITVKVWQRTTYAQAKKKKNSTIKKTDGTIVKYQYSTACYCKPGMKMLLTLV